MPLLVNRDFIATIVLIEHQLWMVSVCLTFFWRGHVPGV